MAIITYVNTLEVKNLSTQVVTVNIKPYTTNVIFNKSGGNISLVKNAIVEAEKDRFDLQQIAQLRKLNLITTTDFQRRVTTETTTGSSGAS